MISFQNFLCISYTGCLLVMNSPSFLLSKKYLFYFKFWRIFCLFIEFCIDILGGPQFKGVILLPLTSSFSDKKSLAIWNALSLYVMCHYSLNILKIFFLSLIFNSLTMIFLGMFFTFILLGVCWASSIYKFVLFVKFGKFSHYFFLNFSEILITYQTIWYCSIGFWGYIHVFQSVL